MPLAPRQAAAYQTVSRVGRDPGRLSWELGLCRQQREGLGYVQPSAMPSVVRTVQVSRCWLGPVGACGLVSCDEWWLSEMRDLVISDSLVMSHKGIHTRYTARELSQASQCNKHSTGTSSDVPQAFNRHPSGTLPAPRGTPRAPHEHSAAPRAPAGPPGPVGTGAVLPIAQHRPL